MRKPVYKTPTARFIRFDNKDVIVASRGDLGKTCWAPRLDASYCKYAGDSSQENECGLSGLHSCFVSPPGSGLIETCPSSDNGYYVNSVGPSDI